MWFPSASSLNGATRFLSPDPYNTLTIPSSANSVITVGAYDAKTNTPADFSGRGAAAISQVFNCSPYKNKLFSLTIPHSIKRAALPVTNGAAKDVPDTV